MLYATWFIAIENGYDKGFKSGYKRGQADVKQSVSWRHQCVKDN
jgi:flagellar biosynthesis/type III secretory pathway protein FliH